MTMSEQQLNMIARVEQLWASAEGKSPTQAVGIYQTGMGALKQAIALDTNNAFAYGFGARFLTFGAYFMANDASNDKQAGIYYSLAREYADKALKLDELQFKPPSCIQYAYGHQRQIFYRRCI